MKFLKMILLLFFVFLGGTTFAANLQSDTVNIGKRSGSADFLFKHRDGGYVKKANNGDWFHSKDGIVEKKFGSGEGGTAGGVNALVNPGFEDGLSNWTNAGSGSLVEVATSTEIAAGDKSARWDAAANNDTLTSDTFDLREKNNAVLDRFGCMADFNYKGSSGDIVVNIYDASSTTVIASATVATSTAWTKQPTLAFPCAEKMKMEFKASGDAPPIDLDSMYLGSNKNMGAAGQGRELVAEGFYTPTTNCEWSKGNLTIADFPVDADCPALSPRLESKGLVFDVTDDDLPTFKLTNMPVGKYAIEVRGITAQNNNSVVELSLVENSTATDFVKDSWKSHEFTATALIPFVISTEFDNPSVADRTFEMQSQSQTGTSVFLKLSDAFTGGGELSIKIYKLSGEVQDTYTPEQANFFVDVDISGANITLTSGGPVPLENASLSISNVRHGSAKIPCSTTNLSTGTTCSVGSEQLGIVFNAPVVGRYKVCGSYVAGVGGTSHFFWKETLDGSQTSLQEGSRIGGGNSAAGVGLQRHCSHFDFSTIGEKVIRGYSEGNSAEVAIYMTGTGSPVANITVELVSHNVSRPQIIDMVDTSLRSGLKVNSAIITNNGTAAIVTGNEWIDSVSRTALGQVEIDPKVGVFNKEPECQVSIRNGASTQQCTLQGGLPTTSKIYVKCENNAAFLDRDFYIFCAGRK